MNARFETIRDHTDLQEYVDDWAKTHPAAAELLKEIADIDELMDNHFGESPSIVVAEVIGLLTQNHQDRRRPSLKAQQPDESD